MCAQQEMSYQGQTSIQHYTIKKIFVGKIGIENNISLGNCNRIEDSSLKSPKLKKQNLIKITCWDINKNSYQMVLTVIIYGG